MRWRQASSSAHPGPMLLREGWNRLRTNGLRACGMEQAGHRLFGARTSPAESGAFGPARCHRLRRNFGSGGVGQDRVSARELRTRHGPRASAHDHVRRNQGFGRGSCPKRIHGLRPLMMPGLGRGTRVPNPPSGEPPGLRPCAGSPRGNRTRLRPRTDPGGSGARTLFWLPPLETAHCERPASAEPDAKGQWGPAAMPGPITVWGWFVRWIQLLP